MLGDVTQQLCVVVDAELVGDGEHEGVGGLDGVVCRELFGELVGFADVALAEAGHGTVEYADLVAGFAQGAEAEVLAVLVVDYWQDAAADGDAWRKAVACTGPSVAVHLDLLGLQLVEGDAGILVSRVELIRFMPFCAAQTAVLRVPAPHQMRSPSPGECG